MPETTQETCASAKDSPFFIKNLLNCDSKPSKPKPVLAATKAALEGGFSLSQVGDLHFPRFDLPAQRFSLPAHYLERTSAWWYPYTLSSSAHLHRTEGKPETDNNNTYYILWWAETKSYSSATVTLLASEFHVDVGSFFLIIKTKSQGLFPFLRFVTYNNIISATSHCTSSSDTRPIKVDFVRFGDRK